MSDSQAYEELTVTSDGVSVIKRFEEDEFPVPAIAFEFTSHRDEEVRLVLSDTVPEDIEVEDLGFHPEYGSEYWVIDDDNSIAFERDLSPDETYTTVYGIRATGSDNVEQFLTEPRFEEVDPPLPEDEKQPEDIIPESDDDVVKEAIAGDGEIPGLEDEGEGEGDEDVETLDLKDPNSPNGQESEQPSDDGDGDGGTTEAAEASVPAVDIDGATLVTAMATEIRQQDVSAEDVKLLRRAFEIAGQDGGTTAAKIEQVQRDVTDLRAYTNALEEFLDDNGTAQQLIEEFQQQVDSFESQLSGIQSNLDSNSEQLAAVSSTVDGFTDEIESITEEMDAVSQEIGAVTEKVDSIDDRVDSVTSEMETLSSDVDEMSGQVDSMDDEFDSLDSAIESVEADIETLEENITDGEVADRVDELQEELEDLQSWQEQIKSTFGG